MSAVDFNSLQQQILGKVVIEADGAVYENETQKSWNALLRLRRPLAFVNVQDKNDVEKAVKFCTDNELEMCVRSGGTSDNAAKDDAVIIDLSEMCRIKIDENSKTALVEGGAKVADVDEALYEKGFVIPLGSFSHLGVAGMTLQGGNGFLTRHYGLSSDNMLEYELIVADGNAITVSAEHNPELFWAMKGHGYNFGIVTSMSFQIHEMPKLIVGGLMFFQLSYAKNVMKTFRDYHAKEDDKCLSLYMMIHIGPTSPELVVRLHYSGSLRRGGEVVQDLLDLSHPYRFRCGPVEHTEFQKQADYMMPSGRYYYGIRGHMLSELKDEVIDNILNYLQDIGAGDYRAGTTIYMNGGFGGKDMEDRYEESSFPYRGQVRYWVGLNASTKKQEDFDALKKWSDGFQAVNAEYDIAPYEGSNAEEAQQRLKALKQQYDPANVFHNNLLNIDPST